MTRHAIDYREHVMHHTVPSAKQMEDSRKTHYFRDEDGERLVVVTELLPNGDYSAWVDGTEETLQTAGYGTTEKAKAVVHRFEIESMALHRIQREWLEREIEKLLTYYAKQSRIGQSLAKQLQRSMELNAELQNKFRERLP